MAFVVGAIGVVVVGAAAHGNHSDYSCHRDHHRNYHEYGDSELRSKISNKENQVRNKDSDVESLRRRMNDNFNSRINELKRERNYYALNYSPDSVVREVKSEMRSELNAEISQDKQELEAIDKMIARINEIELQAKRE